VIITFLLRSDKHEEEAILGWYTPSGDFKG